MCEEIKKEKNLRVVLLEPGKLAKAAVIESGLKNLQKTVGGYIEAMYPFEEEVCIICNEEGKLLGLPANRAVFCDGQITDIIAGTCFICSCGEEDFGSLTEEQQQRYMKLFQYPERFLRINGGVIAMPYNPEEG